MPTFVPNPAAIPVIEAMLAPECKAAAEVIVENAKGIAQAEAFETGDYMDGIEAIEQETSAQVFASDWKSYMIEYGTRLGFAARHVLTRAAQAAGYLVMGSRQ